MKKTILAVALILPIGIFIFLKKFGKNEFSIPVYFEKGVEDAPRWCKKNYDTPYLVSDSLLKHFGWNKKVVMLMIDSSSVSPGLKRLKEEFNEEVQLIFPTGETNFIDQVYACDLLLQKPWTAVVIDDQRRIRGYYDPKTREEVDRLFVELNILLKKY
jgi:hypothetical protein